MLMIYTVQMTPTERTLQATKETWEATAALLRSRGDRLANRIDLALMFPNDSVRMTFDAETAARLLQVTNAIPA